MWFKVATFSTARNVKLAEAPYVDTHSFYPPYSWRIVTCSSCGNQVGWHFHNTDPKSPSGSKPTGISTPPAHSAGAKPAVAPPVGGAAAAAAAKSLVINVDIASMTEEAIVDKAVGEMCLTLPQGWWAYQWCHKREVRQYHEEAGKRTMDWSLGKFDAQGRKHRVNPHAASLAGKRSRFYSQFYVNGQPCDETGSGRATEVQFSCCKDGKGVHILDITEPALCKYRLRICLPDLCHKYADPKDIAAASATATATANSGAGTTAAATALAAATAAAAAKAAAAVAAAPFEASAGAVLCVDETITHSHRLRAAPSLSGPVLGSLPGGAAVKVLEQRGDWLRVQYSRAILQSAVVPAGSSSMFDVGHPTPPNAADAIGKGWTLAVSGGTRYLTPCSVQDLSKLTSFYGLFWDRVLVEDGDDAMWLRSIAPQTALSR